MELDITGLLKSKNKFLNLKNFKTYIMLGVVKNKTNESDGQVMVLYCDMNGDDVYVREFNEFHEKFRIIK